MQRVKISITDFPLDYWHPLYVHQALTSMGEVTDIHSSCVFWDDRTVITLWLDTLDTKLIPFTLWVGHENNMTECSIFLEGRQDPRPPPLQPPPPDQEDAIQSGQQPIQDVQIQQPYIPPWRRRVLQATVIRDGPDRRGSPAAVAAQSLGFHQRRHYLAREPGPAEILKWRQMAGVTDLQS